MLAGMVPSSRSTTGKTAARHFAGPPTARSRVVLIGQLHRAAGLEGDASMPIGWWRPGGNGVVGREGSLRCCAGSRQRGSCSHNFGAVFGHGAGEQTRQ